MDFLRTRAPPQKHRDSESYAFALFQGPWLSFLLLGIFRPQPYYCYLDNVELTFLVCGGGDIFLKTPFKVVGTKPGLTAIRCSFFIGRGLREPGNWF